MSKFIPLLLIVSLFYAPIKYNGSSTAPVVVAGAVVKNIHNELVKKYPRDKCPICKGTGKYLSGDGLAMVDCGYCEIKK